MNYRFDVLQNQSKFSEKRLFNNYSNLQSTDFQSNINACTFIIVDIINHYVSCLVWVSTVILKQIY